MVLARVLAVLPKSYIFVSSDQIIFLLHMLPKYFLLSHAFNSTWVGERTGLISADKWVTFQSTTPLTCCLCWRRRRLHTDLFLNLILGTSPQLPLRDGSALLHSHPAFLTSHRCLLYSCTHLHFTSLSPFTKVPQYKNTFFLQLLQPPMSMLFACPTRSTAPLLSWCLPGSSQWENYTPPWWNTLACAVRLSPASPQPTMPRGSSPSSCLKLSGMKGCWRMSGVKFRCSSWLVKPNRPTTCTPFMSKFTVDLYHLLKVEHLCISVYHPQTDRLVKRFNQTLKQRLWRVVTESNHDWDLLLPCVLFTIWERYLKHTPKVGLLRYTLAHGQAPLCWYSNPTSPCGFAKNSAMQSWQTNPPQMRPRINRCTVCGVSGWGLFQPKRR